MEIEIAIVIGLLAIGWYFSLILAWRKETHRNIEVVRALQTLSKQQENNVNMLGTSVKALTESQKTIQIIMAKNGDLRAKIMDESHVKM